MRTEHKIEAVNGKNIFHGRERVHSISKLTGWENIESLEMHLSYFYNRVYLEVTYIYNGIRLTSCSKPMQYMFEAEKEIAKQLFEEDKKSGFVANDYIFN